MTDEINALVLAAGYGTRLRPLTLTTPKCLVPIGDKPILEHWLENLEKCGCSNAIINTHYLAEKVHSFLDKRQISKMRVKISHEEKLLGTAGTLINNQKSFNEGIGLLIHADNATRFDLNQLIKAHRSRPRGCLLTMVTFKTDKPKTCGIVKTDKQGIVQAFYEKVSDPPGTTANGAVYAFETNLIEEIKKTFPE